MTLVKCSGGLGNVLLHFSGFDHNVKKQGSGSSWRWLSSDRQAVVRVVFFAIQYMLNEL